MFEVFLLFENFSPLTCIKYIVQLKAFSIRPELKFNSKKNTGKNITLEVKFTRINDYNIIK